MNISLKQIYALPLLVLTIIGIIALVIFSPLQYQWSPPCLFKKELGLYCTFCGSFRSVYFLLKGNFLQAWFHNPLIVSAAPVITFGVIKAGINLLRDKSFQVNISTRTFYLLLFIVLAFTFIRNTGFYTHHF